MKRMMSYLPVLLILALFAMPALAENDNLVDVHFYSPVAVPGSILPAGNYVFRIMDQASGTHYVEVEHKDGTPAAGFIQILPTYAKGVPNNVVINTSKPDEAGVVRFKSMFLPRVSVHLFACRSPQAG